MVHLFKYVRVTKYLPLILSTNKSGMLKWYIDGSYSVQPNMRGHTGGRLKMGRRLPILTSIKQKLNTRSSTKSEIIGVDQLMTSVLWTKYFLETWGYVVSENIIYQEKKRYYSGEKRQVLEK